MRVIYEKKIVISKQSFKAQKNKYIKCIKINKLNAKEMDSFKNFGRVSKN